MEALVQVGSEASHDDPIDALLRKDGEELAPCGRFLAENDAKIEIQIGAFLRELRERAGMRQLDVQIRSGGFLVQSIVSRIESGAIRPTAPQLLVLAHLYRVDAQMLAADIMSFYQQIPVSHLTQPRQ